MSQKFGLPEITINKINTILANFPQVKKALIYGSRAKGNFKNGSDIDLCLYGNEDLNLAVLYKISQDLDDLLLPYTIDLSIFHQLNEPDFIDHIQRVGILFYNRPKNSLKKLIKT